MITMTCVLIHCCSQQLDTLIHWLDTLLLADVFENFRNKCIEIYELDPAHFLSAPGLAWQACLKKTGVRLKLLTDVDMLLIIEKWIRGGTCHAIHRYAKANNKYMKNFDKHIESSYLMHLDANNLYGWAVSQRLPVNGFEWVKELSEFDERFIKNCDENSDKRYIPEVVVEYPKNSFNLHSIVIYHFYLYEWKLKNARSLFIAHMTKKRCCTHKSLKTSIKSWINTKKSTQSNSI